MTTSQVWLIPKATVILVISALELFDSLEIVNLNRIIGVLKNWQI